MLVLRRAAISSAARSHTRLVKGWGIIDTVAQLTGINGSIVSRGGRLQARLAEMGFVGVAGCCAAVLLALLFTIER